MCIRDRHDTYGASVSSISIQPIVWSASWHLKRSHTFHLSPYRQPAMIRRRGGVRKRSGYFLSNSKYLPRLRLGKPPCLYSPPSRRGAGKPCEPFFNVMHELCSFWRRVYCEMLRRRRTSFKRSFYRSRKKQSTSIRQRERVPHGL